MDALKMVPMIVLILAISGIIIGAAAITLGEFNDTTDNVAATNALNNATEGITTIAEQQPTLAIISVMVIHGNPLGFYELE